MAMLRLDGVTHWSIPVNDLEEGEKFYQEVLGLEYRGRLGNSNMSCFTVGGHSIVYREHGFFTGRELYFLDPSGNMLELRDATWKPGMPKPTFDEIARS